MTLSDHLPDLFQREPWSWLLVAAVVVFFLDDLIIGLFGVYLLGGIVAVVVVVALLALVFTRTAWGRDKWRQARQFIANP